MWEIYDIVGAQIDEFDSLIIRVYVNTNTKKYSYVLTIEYHGCGEINFRFGKNKDIDKFYKFLKNNGSCVKNSNEGFQLVGKSIYNIKYDNVLHIICKYDSDPFNDETFEEFDDSITELSFVEILNNEFGEGNCIMDYKS